MPNNEPRARGQPLHLRVFLASPGDVAYERALALEVLERLPYDSLLRGRISIEVVAWDKPGGGTPLLATMTPQAAIATGLPKPSECDIVIVILWSRMGTPLPPDYVKADGSPYLSGTEWEYLDALDPAGSTGRPDVLVYRRTEKRAVELDDPDFDDKRSQWQKVQAFFARFRNPDGSIKSGCNEYSKPEDFREQLNQHMRAVIGRLLERPPKTGEGPRALDPVPPFWSGAPFPGLRAYTPDDARIFFGRGRETDDLVRRLDHASTRLLMVIGASGSGKSSLVAAGLLPRLASNAVAGSKDWLLPERSGDSTQRQWTGLRFTPAEMGDDPFLAVAAKLAPLLKGDAVRIPALAGELRAGPDALVVRLAALLDDRPSWTEVLVYVDQFEELFTSVTPNHRAPYVAMLAAAAARSTRIRVVSTIRASFFHRCIEDTPRMAALLTESGATFLLSAPGPGALYEMITAPAGQAGLRFEPDLPQRIVDDVGPAAGGLALLAFALRELYAARTEEGVLTHAAYDKFGGVKGAVLRRADETFAKLGPGAQGSLGEVFRELIDVDDAGIATRRRAPRTRVALSPGAAQLVDGFIDARLMVSGGDATGASMVEVAHEVLLREWLRLADWIRVRADALRLRRQLEAAAREWDNAGRDPLYLWPHERLQQVAQAMEFLGITHEQLNEPTRTFAAPESGRLIAELVRPDTTHHRRAQIGDRLDALGDPRPGIGIRDDGSIDQVWCAVRGGTVVSTVDGGEHVVRPFLISQYPITYTQYKHFLDAAGGFRSTFLWWKDLVITERPGDQYRPTGNCPAENISWYDAMAFCRWLSARAGYEVRLPTEWEWQQAATGGDPAREYPWGGEWRDACANTDEGRLSRTTAVGMFPAGASLQGVLDLSGNVWEWCLNKFEAPDDVDVKGDALRVLRGGSWFNYRDGARTTSRFRSAPDFRSYDIGFRVVRSGSLYDAQPAASDALALVRDC